MGHETFYGNGLMELQKYVRMRLVDLKYSVETTVYICISVLMESLAALASS